MRTEVYKYIKHKDHKITVYYRGGKYVAFVELDNNILHKVTEVLPIDCINKCKEFIDNS